MVGPATRASGQPDQASDHPSGVVGLVGTARSSGASMTASLASVPKVSTQATSRPSRPGSVPKLCSLLISSTDSGRIAAVGLYWLLQSPSASPYVARLPAPIVTQPSRGQANDDAPRVVKEPSEDCSASSSRFGIVVESTRSQLRPGIPTTTTR